MNINILLIIRSKRSVDENGANQSKKNFFIILYNGKPKKLFSRSFLGYVTNHNQNVVGDIPKKITRR